MTFNELNMSEPILKAVREKGYDELTPIQQRAIPIVLRGADILGIAQTGTGKTAAFALPLLQRLIEERSLEREPSAVAGETVPLRRERRGRSHGKSGRRAIRSLVLTPTRELALQIGESFADYGKYTGLKHATIFGGVKQGPQTDRLRRGIDILIATPGRLLDLIAQGEVELGNLSHFVLDEADRMLDMGFFDDIMRIVSQLPSERQTIMFSATLPPKIRKLAKEIMHDPAEVNIAVSKPNEAIEQSAYVCYENQKMGIVRELFSKPAGTKTIIFSSSKQKVKELAFSLKRMKLNVAPMHSDLKQEQREEVMLDFKNGKIDVLVATDIVARGIDIEDIGTVINFDVPHDPEDYIHRIGRTARAAATGTAITFVNEKEQGKFHRIETFIEREIPKAALPEQLGPGPAYDPGVGERRGGRGGRNGSGRGGRNRGRDRGGDSRPALESRPDQGGGSAGRSRGRRHGRGPRREERKKDAES